MFNFREGSYSEFESGEYRINRVHNPWKISHVGLWHFQECWLLQEIWNSKFVHSLTRIFRHQIKFYINVCEVINIAYMSLYKKVPMAFVFKRLKDMVIDPGWKICGWTSKWVNETFKVIICLAGSYICNCDWTMIFNQPMRGQIGLAR